MSNCAVTIREIKAFLQDGLKLAIKEQKDMVTHQYSTALDTVLDETCDMNQGKLIYDIKNIGVCPARHGQIVYRELQGYINNKSSRFLLKSWQGNQTESNKQKSLDICKTNDNSSDESIPYMFGFSSDDSNDNSTENSNDGNDTSSDLLDYITNSEDSDIKETNTNNNTENNNNNNNNKITNEPKQISSFKDNNSEEEYNITTSQFLRNLFGDSVLNQKNDLHSPPLKKRKIE